MTEHVNSIYTLLIADKSTPKKSWVLVWVWVFDFSGIWVWVISESVENFEKASSI